MSLAVICSRINFFEVMQNFKFKSNGQIFITENNKEKSLTQVKTEIIYR